MNIVNVTSELGNGVDATILGYEIFLDYYKRCELQTKRWILNNLKEDSVFVDVGANIGILSLTALQIIKTGKVLAIEPTSTFDLLSQNLGVNDCVILSENAVSDFDGVEEAELAKIWGHEDVRSDFEFRKLDSLHAKFHLGKIDCVKIDTDGFELEVLRGAARLISQFRPAIIVELNEALARRSHTIQEVVDLLIEYKYTHAQICDGANYIFTSDWEMGQPWPNAITLTTDREPILLNFDLGNKLRTEGELALNEMGASLEFEENFRFNFSANLGKWSYAVSYQALLQEIPSNFGIKIRGKLIQGALGIFISNSRGDKQLSMEVAIESTGYFERIIYGEKWENRLIFRHVSSEKLKAEIESVEFFEVLPKISHTRSQFNNLSNLVSIIEPSELILRWNPLYLDRTKLPNQNGWLQEQISAHVLKAIVTSYKPQRFFEFGTWEGFSSLLVLKNSDAAVWSLNDVEYLKDGQYGSRYTDFFEDGYNFLAGHLIDKDTYKDRYHQIIGDSLTFDFSSFDHFFDCIFVDGGHDSKTVANDTFAAMMMLKESGNIIIWDDFQIDETFQKTGPASLEVYESIGKLAPELSITFDLFYLRGTQFLVGIKK